MLTAYVAIAFRGDIIGNQLYAKTVQHKLNLWFPQVEWYFPTLDEELQGYIEQLQSTLKGNPEDCTWALCFPIVRKKDFLLSVRWVTEGVALEMVVAEYADKPVLHLDCIDDDEAKDELAHFLMDIIGEE